MCSQKAWWQLFWWWWDDAMMVLVTADGNGGLEVVAVYWVEVIIEMIKTDMDTKFTTDNNGQVSQVQSVVRRGNIYEQH